MSAELPLPALTHPGPIVTLQGHILQQQASFPMILATYRDYTQIAGGGVSWDMVGLESAVVGGTVLAESESAVEPAWHEPGAGAGIAGAQEVRDPGSPSHRPRERRHRGDGVLAQQPGQLRDVVSLECRDVPFQKCLLVGLPEIHHGPGLASLLGHRGTCSLQSAVHRGLGRAEDLGGLARREGQHVTQHEDCSLPGGQPLQGRDERQFDRADEFDIHRGPTRHLGMGQGIHFCVGAPLGRDMSYSLFEELISVADKWEIDLEYSERVLTPNFRGFHVLPLTIA